MRALAVAAIAALLGIALPSGAKTVCGQFGDPDGRFYVLEKVKTKNGAHGSVVGYLITEAGEGTPFSGSYFIFGGSEIWVAATEGVGQGGFGAAARFRNWSAPISADTGNGQQYVVQVNGTAGTVTELPTTSTSFEDCKNVPKFGVAD
jgi:hypothetical protein